MLKIPKIIFDFPKQFKSGLELSKGIKIKGKFENIIVSGMGGSAWPAEILFAWADPSIPFYINRTYNLPLWASKKTLNIFISYSGNTEECLCSYQQALKKNLPIVSISSGGKLKEISQKNNTLFIEIPAGFVPRMATGYIFTSLYFVLFNTGLIKNKLSELLEMADSLNPANYEKQGKELAEKIKRKVPLIYTSDRLKVIGYIWKIKLNENVKIPAFCNYFPELNHNEMSVFESLDNFYVLILKISEERKILKRMGLTAGLLKSKNIPNEIIEIKGKTLLEKMFSAIILADWVSYYLSLEHKVDFLSTKTQEEFKKKMQK